jgi:multidrug efflux pump subunit AcrB
MQSLGVTASQVNAALRQVNVNAAGGQAEIAGSRQSVRVLGNAETAYDLSQTQIRSAAGARSSWPTSPGARRLWRTHLDGQVNGKQVVTFSITRARGRIRRHRL